MGTQTPTQPVIRRGTRGSTKAPTPSRLRYYDLRRNSQKMARHFSDPLLNTLLVEDFNKFTIGGWGKPFKHGQFPDEFDVSDWRLYRRGRQPRFWKYVASYACHWLVNFNLRLVWARASRASGLHG